MIDDDLRALVSVAAPPEFAARVRARLVREDARRARTQRLSWLAAAAVLMLALAAGYSWRTGDRMEVAVARTLPADVPSASIAPLRAPAEARRPSAADATADVRTATPSAVAGRERSAQAATESPVVVFDDAERRALQRLLASAMTVPVLPPEPAADTLDIPDMVFTPLTIEPIVEGAPR